MSHASEDVQKKNPAGTQTGKTSPGKNTSMLARSEPLRNR